MFDFNSGRSSKPESALNWLLSMSLAALVISGGGLDVLQAQDDFPAPGPVPGAEDGADGDGDGDGDGEEEEEVDEEKEREDFLRGAHLDTDSEVDRLLRRASDFLAEKNYNEATVVLQHIIDKGSASLTTGDGRVYRPAREFAEEIIAALPAEALSIYRLSADGEAKGLLGDLSTNRDEVLIAKVVSRFLMSTWGDDAAFLLGSLYLDRHEYMEARRLFAVLLDRYPDSNIPTVQILTRLLVTEIRLGNRSEAGAIWKRLEALEGVPSDLLAALKQEVEQESKQGEAMAGRPGDWLMAYGNTARDGRMQDLQHLKKSPGDKSFWPMAWRTHFRFKAPQRQAQTYRRTVQGPNINARARLVGLWESSYLRPAGRLLIQGDRIYFRSHDETVCCDAVTGKRIWVAKEFDPAKSKPSSNTTRHGVFMGGIHYGRSNGRESALFFNDRIGKALNLINGVVYQVEENHLGGWGSSRRGIFRVNGVAQKQPAKPAQGNRLAAYDAKTGKRIWRLGRDVKEDAVLGEVHFLGPPVPFGNVMLVAYEKSSELSLAALDNRGKLVWNVFLSSYLLKTRMAPQKPIGIVVDGNTVYVASGNGVLFALNGLEGRIRWASRYQRSEPDQVAGSALSVRGWDEDFMTLHDGVVVLLPSDAAAALAFDTKTGQQAFRIPYEDPRYPVGAGGGFVYLSGDRGIECLNLANGKRVWNTGVLKSSGRAALTENALYVPVQKKIYCFDRSTGKKLHEMAIATPHGDPVGNIYSDGKMIFTLGMDQVYAVGASQGFLDSYNKKLTEKEEPHLYLKRGRLHAGEGRLDQAAADFRNVLKEGAVGMDQDEARSALLRVLLEKVDLAPKTADATLKEAQGLAKSPQERLWIGLAEGKYKEATGDLAGAVTIYSDLAVDTSGTVVTVWDKGEGQSRLKTQPAFLGLAALKALRANPKYKEQVQTLLASRWKKMVSMASSSGNPHLLRAIMALSVDEKEAVEAVLGAAKELKGLDQAEGAEHLLLELSKDSHAPSAAAGFVALAALHQELGWKRQARMEWQELGQRYADVKPLTFEDKTGAELAKVHLGELGEGDGKSFPASPEMPAPPWKIQWKLTGRFQKIEAGGATRSEFVDRHLYLYSQQDKRLHCYEMATGKALWLAKVASAGAPTSRHGYTHTTFGYGYGRQNVNALRRFGHIMVVKSGAVLAGYGLLTGKRLWHVATDKPAQVTGRENPFLPAGVVVGDGLVAELISAQRVRVLDAATGAPLWERTFKKIMVSDVKFANGCLHLIISGNNRIWSCDTKTGRMLGDTELEGRYYAHYPLTFGPKGVIYRARDKQQMNNATIVYRELPSGKLIWQKETESFSTRMGFLGKDHLYYMNQTNEIGVLDVVTGKLAWKKTFDAEKVGRASGLALRPNGKELVVISVLNRRLPNNQYERKSWVETMELKTGKKLSQISLGVGNRYSGNLDINTIAKSGEYIPVYSRSYVDYARRNRMQNRRKVSRTTSTPKIVFHRRSDGTLVKNLKLPPDSKNSSRSGFNRAPTIVGNLMLMLLGDRIVAYGHQTKKAKTTKRKKKKPSRSARAQKPKNKKSQKKKSAK